MSQFKDAPSQPLKIHADRLKWLNSTIKCMAKYKGLSHSPWLYTDNVSGDHYTCGLVKSFDLKGGLKYRVILEAPMGSSKIRYRFAKGRQHQGLEVGNPAWFVSPCETRLNHGKKRHHDYIFYDLNGDDLEPCWDLEFNKKNRHLSTHYHRLKPGPLPAYEDRHKIRIMHV